MLGLLLDDAQKSVVALPLSRIAAMAEPLIEFTELAHADLVRASAFVTIGSKVANDN
ncbi:MAG TPA: hypothetical protein PLX20_06635 [Rhodocyclaceae bacterium]|nr:hypothetical protein [Rhodocyclaceae bacterium]HMZ83554.1 hypothetical protein [Rhodocyclaceae bacterium]HNH12789.1 hypothetical protein [Rhodocyclaceae bacterium]HNH99080.1 hypothetical protein [Rhodocyclaceae bacterium]